jgi:TonB family protein
LDELMPCTKWAKRFAAALFSFCAAALLTSPRAAAQLKNTPPPELRPGVTILTPTEGVDFTCFIHRLVPRVGGNWYMVMPKSGLNGEKRIVVAVFRILKDGSLHELDPQIERSSGNDELDRAARKSILKSAPFDPLPAGFYGPEIKLRFVFFYNFPYTEDAPAAGQSNCSAFSAMQLSVEIQTPAEGVDFGDYLKRLQASMKRDWYARMPEAALRGEKGTVTIEFHIQPDGSIFPGELRIKTSSHDEDLDQAAFEAIRNSAPFEPLPAAFHGPSIKVRCFFDYRGARPTPRIMPLAQRGP